MDSKAVTPEQTNPFYASGQSGKTYASVVAASADASKAGADVSSAKEFNSSPEAMSGISEKDIGGGADKVKPSLEVADDGKFSDEEDSSKEVSDTPAAASSLSPKTDGVGVSEEKKAMEVNECG